MRGRLQAARTPIDANANVCRKSVHEWDGQLQSTDSWVFMLVRPLSLFLPLLIIDTVNLISDFDTAPPGTPESNTILTMSPIDILVPRERHSPLYAISTWKLQGNIPPMWTAHQRCKHTDKCLLAITNIAPIPFLANTNL